jgi:recombinational DNA repair protein RecR
MDEPASESERIDIWHLMMPITIDTLLQRKKGGIAKLAGRITFYNEKTGLCRECTLTDSNSKMLYCYQTLTEADDLIAVSEEFRRVASANEEIEIGGHYNPPKKDSSAQVLEMKYIKTSKLEQML